MSVYFATAGDYLKIGYSNDPFSRVGTITMSGKRPEDIPHGADAELVGWIPGDEWRERTFHIQHLEQRVAGEWFRLDRAVAEAHIWEDPRGVDIRRMSAMAVFACLQYPALTRAEIESVGVPIEARSPAAGERLMDQLLTAPA